MAQRAGALGEDLSTAEPLALVLMVSGQQKNWTKEFGNEILCVELPVLGCELLTAQKKHDSQL